MAPADTERVRSRDLTIPPPSVSNGEDMGDESRPTKRRRIPMACVSCRTRKSRCDGGKPMCSTCSNLGFECLYTQVGPSSNMVVGKEYMAELEQRLSHVERTLQTVQGQLKNSAEISAGADGNDGEPRAADTVDNTGSVDEVDSDADKVDAMGAVIFADETESGYFGRDQALQDSESLLKNAGPSSNIAFLRRLSQLTIEVSNVTIESPQADNTRDLAGRIFSFTRPMKQHDGETTRHPTRDAFVLPSEETAQGLLTSFFSNTGYLFPFIRQETFMSKYITVRASSPSHATRSWLGLLNMIFAMAIVTMPGEDHGTMKQSQNSAVYYQRALSLCDRRVLKGANIDIVHFLLLWAQYLQGTQKSMEAWGVHCTVVRAALQLGLQSDAYIRQLPSIEQEVSRRTWFGIICLDRTMSMTLGRPAAFPERYIKLDLPSEYPNTSTQSSDDTTSYEKANPGNVPFFSATVKLYGVIWVIIDQLYDMNLGCGETLSSSDLLTRVLQIEDRLLRWECDLPEGLKLIKSHKTVDDASGLAALDGTLHLMKLRIILTLRYTNVRLLLHRPVVLKLLDRHDRSRAPAIDDGVLRQVGPNSVRACMESSSKLLSIIHSALIGQSQGHDLLGAWWFSLYYTFNAALTVFACFLAERSSSTGVIDPVSIPSNQAEVITKLLQAVEVLQGLVSDNRMLDRCSHYLNTLVKVARKLGQPETDVDLSTQQNDANESPITMPGFTELDSQFDFDAIGDFGGFVDLMNFSSVC